MAHTHQTEERSEDITCHTSVPTRFSCGILPQNGSAKKEGKTAQIKQKDKNE